jgi:hypothetical protein
MIDGYGVVLIKASIPASRRIPSLVLFGDEMPMRQTKKMMHASVAIGVTLTLLAVFAMLMLKLPLS